MNIPRISVYYVLVKLQSRSKSDLTRPRLGEMEGKGNRVVCLLLAPSQICEQVFQQLISVQGEKWDFLFKNWTLCCCRWYTETGTSYPLYKHQSLLLNRTVFIVVCGVTNCNHPHLSTKDISQATAVLSMTWDLNIAYFCEKGVYLQQKKECQASVSCRNFSSHVLKPRSFVSAIFQLPVEFQAFKTFNLFAPSCIHQISNTTNIITIR